MRDHRIRRRPPLQGHPDHRPGAARVPRLRLGRESRLLEDDGLEYVRAVGNLAQLKQAVAGERLARDDRGWPHTLGDPRRRQRGQRAPAHRLRGRQACDRPERDRRELPRAEVRARGGRPHLLVRDRRRGGRPPARERLRRRPRRGGARRLRPARRALHLRRHPPQRARPARRRALRDAARGRARRGRELPRLEPRGVPRRDPPRRLSRARRDRRDHLGGRPRHPCRGRQPGRAGGDPRSTGTRRSPSARGSRPSC